jgi:hypothetical protein
VVLFFDLFDRAGLRAALIQLVAFNSRALTEGLQDRLEPGVEFVVGGHLVQKGVVDEPDLARVVRHCRIGLRQSVELARGHVRMELRVTVGGGRFGLRLKM